MLGILLIDKPLGITSHDVVNQVRRKLNTKRVGHAGTLDPAATGLLIVAVGPATRFLQYLPLEPKVYVGDVTFGIKTTTQDSEGEVVESGDVPEDLEGLVRAALPQFLGLIDQLPPMYSAIKKAGKPLYAYARKGEEVERTARTIHIDSIAIEAVNGPTVTIRVVCSGGTYLRTLAHDLGDAIGCGAYLSALNRVAVGKFELPDAIPLSEVSPEHLMPLADALPPMPLVELDVAQAADIREGRALVVMGAPETEFVGLLLGGSVIGIAKVSENILQPECVIPVLAFAG
jgi:tRNA pseudouridine55 synthase